MGVSRQIKERSKTGIKLKQFYNSSQAYLDRLRRHNEETFASYIALCKELIPAGASILDCGCGIGASSYLLAKEGFKVTATDVSTFFISDAKKQYGNTPNLKFLVEDAGKMSFSDHSFDAVCSFDLLEHVTDVKIVLKEMARVVKREAFIIIFTHNFLDPIAHLKRGIKWRAKDAYKPWEARSRVTALYRAMETSFLAMTKFIGLNKKIYYLEPVLSDNKDACGKDFDATWLTNRFDVESILKELGFSIKDTLYHNYEGRILRLMKMLRLPEVLKSFYAKMRAPCVIVGIKK
jgi:ubiquinone/menaquinone biosynthesis C-methylase UbiE